MKLSVHTSDRLERGFVIGIRNMRGMTSRGLTEAVQEYDLVNKYGSWAEAVDATHPRTAGALRDVAAAYRDEGAPHEDRKSVRGGT